MENTRLKGIIRTTGEISWSTLLFAASIAGLYWLLHAYLGLSWEGTILILTPTALLGALAAIYGYYMGRQRRRIREGHPASSGIFQHRFRFFVFFLVLLLPVSLAVYFLYVRDVTLTLVFAVAAGLIALWVIPKLAEQAKRFGIFRRNP